MYFEEVLVYIFFPSCDDSSCSPIISISSGYHDAQIISKIRKQHLKTRSIYGKTYDMIYRAVFMQNFTIGIASLAKVQPFLVPYS